MTQPPAQPKLYHITHVDNLAPIVGEGALVSDAAMFEQAGPATAIGMASIKTRRLALPVGCHSTHYVGDFVPFFFCPRSIMLYVIHCANNPELEYRGGQGPIVHLEADLHNVIAWAEQNGVCWAFSDRNAGAYYASFYRHLEDLGQVDWEAVGERDFRSPSVKEGKQAEFLVHRRFPWDLIERVGVADGNMRE